MTPELTLPGPIVSVDWLSQHLHDPQVVIVDCRFSLADPTQGRRAYDAGHLPTAQYLDLNRDLSSPVQAQGGRHPLPDLSALAQRLAACGISSHPATVVVAYDDAQGAFAARLWWLLRYVGHTSVAVLDGGWQAWQRAGLPTTTTVMPRLPGQFQMQVQPGWVVDRTTVQHQRAQGRVLIDSRAPERFRGEVEPIDPIAGTIPGAANVFWKTMLDDHGCFLSPDALRERWATWVVQDPIVFCGSGVTACVNLLAQAIAGYPLSPLYVGGWSDWCTTLTKAADTDGKADA
ncbi:MAG: sulfurtransferase [Leptolyngbyaceae cyanobacterium T60_A2020_046]|nr:sulfurtransferase [Leptolyngbyaceae cyanobacterium T60_A2020_046]